MPTAAPWTHLRHMGPPQGGSWRLLCGVVRRGPRSCSRPVALRREKSRRRPAPRGLLSVKVLTRVQEAGARGGVI